MDADLSVPIDALTGALRALVNGDAPIVIGSRKIQGARIEQRQPLLRKCLGDGFTWCARLLVWRTMSRSPVVFDVDSARTTWRFTAQGRLRESRI